MPCLMPNLTSDRYLPGWVEGTRIFLPLHHEAPFRLSQTHLPCPLACLALPAHIPFSLHPTPFSLFSAFLGVVEDFLSGRGKRHPSTTGGGLTTIPHPTPAPVPCPLAHTFPSHPYPHCLPPANTPCPKPPPKIGKARCTHCVLALFPENGGKQGAQPHPLTWEGRLCLSSPPLSLSVHWGRGKTADEQAGQGNRSRQAGGRWWRRHFLHAFPLFPLPTPHLPPHLKGKILFAGGKQTAVAQTNRQASPCGNHIGNRNIGMG